MPRPLRAVRGVHYREQPHKRFRLQVPTRFQDGDKLGRAEVAGNPEQGYLGPVILGKIPYITTTSRDDFLSAFNKRANFHSNKRIDRRTRGITRTMIRRLVPKQMPTIEWDPELYGSWLNLFDTEKRLRMERAYKSWGMETLAGYSSKQIFTKIEALVKDFDEVAPRLIFKGSDVYNMISGPMFKELMDRFVACENSLDNLKFKISYRQHTPEIVDFLEGKACRSWLESDFSANDKSQVSDVIDLELQFIKRLGAPKWFLKLHRAANRFSVYNTKFGLSAIVENQLPSGATDGTFRNSFWNLCILNAWMVIYKVPDARAVILGDDVLVGLPKRVRRAAKNYRKTASMMEMEAKVTTSPLLQRCHFLSKHFVPVMRGENHHVMLPFIGKVLAKFNARPNTNQRVSDDEYMAGKALSHCYEYRFCHIMRNKFKERANFHLLRSGGKFSVEGVTWHVRVHSAYANEIVSLLQGSMDWPDLVTTEDLTLFWIGLCDLTWTDLEPVIDEIILSTEYRVIDRVPAGALVDY